jgi:hypothetical protein
MNEKKVCSLCCRNAIPMGGEGEICNDCLDLFEFGYPSFPAYPLNEAEMVSSLQLLKAFTHDK